MQSSLQSLVTWVDMARKRGSRASELLYVGSKGFSAVVRRGKVVHRDPTRQERLLVRCWLEGGRLGQASGPADEVESLVDSALEAAGSAPEDPLAGPVGRLPTRARSLGIDDRRYGMVEDGDRLDVLLAAERGARDVDRRVSPGAFRYDDQRIYRAVANSKGVADEEWSTVYRADGELHVDASGGVLSMRDFLENRAFASIASLPYGTLLAQRAMALCKGGPRISGPVRAGLHARATAALFAALAPAFTYEALTRGEVFLAEGFDSGERTLDARLHLLDDGTVPGGLRSRMFDDRGVSPVPLALIREGHVERRFLDPRAARQADERPTGHVWPHGVGANNLLLRSGTRSMHAMMSELDSTVFLIDHFEDMEGLDLVTGHLRVVASGHLCQGTTQVGAARRVVLEGDLRQVLNQVVALTSDTDRIGHVDAPGLILDGFVATGKL